jgi:signal peptidase II
MAGFMTKRKRMVMVLLTIILCVGCDQVAKEMAKSHLPKTKVLSFAGDVVRLDYTENRGAVLSFEYCLPQAWRGPTLTAAVAIFLGLLVGYLLFISVLRPLPVVALSLIGGGALSNLLDRIVFGGYVIDFLSLGWGGLRTAIFNVADAAIVAGTVLVAFNAIWWSFRSGASRKTILSVR